MFNFEKMSDCELVCLWHRNNVAHNNIDYSWNDIVKSNDRRENYFIWELLDDEVDRRGIDAHNFTKDGKLMDFTLD